MLTQERLKELLHYDSESGVFTWVNTNPYARNIKPGDRAGCLDVSKGYICIKVDGHKYKAHRLAFLYMTGSWPTEHVDHIDHIRSNNAWANLRESSLAENSRNRSMNSNNTSGYQGVSWHSTRKRWTTQIWIGGKQRTIGYFTDLGEAAEAYRIAAETAGYHDNHGLNIGAA
jgi:hypothetical protein